MLAAMGLGQMPWSLGTYASGVYHYTESVMDTGTVCQISTSIMTIGQ